MEKDSAELIVSEPLSFDTPEWVKFPMSHVDGCLMIAERNLRAYCFAEKVEENLVYVHSLEVHPNFRRQGLGSAIVKKLFAWYPDHDFMLHSHHDPVAQGFWAKHDFKMFSGYFTGGCCTPGLIRTNKDVRVFYTGDDPLTIAYLGARWSSTEQRFLTVEGLNGAETYPKLRYCW